MSDYTSQKHDVFISFRGEDTRVGFTSHLREALRRKNIETYVDDRFDKGDEISSAIEKAIEESKISVIIFSKKYATSRWCLDELVHILACRRTKKQLVVPVFYRVDPSHVRKQEESYAIALDSLEGRFSYDKIRKWRKALTTAANLVGWSSSAISPDSTLIDGITEDILRKLKRVLCADDYEGQLVGMTKHIENVEFFLCIGSPTVRRIGIWGLAGMGKTILANVVFNRLSYQFEACCFLGSIGENWENGRKSSYLRSELFSKLLEVNDHQNMDTLLLASFDKNRLQRKKVLIVLDDVNDLGQLDALIGDCSFGPESRIIVTTRDKQLLKNVVDQMYQVKELTYDEALQLFHMSLKGITPPAHLAKVVDKVVYYSGGIPRAVKFLGFLFCSKDVENWKDELKKLKELLPGQIEDFLTRSYNLLDRKQKTIFLDIACFFKGNDKDFVERILDGCKLFARTGIIDLIDKCLITTMDKQLRMFNLVQSMGWEIVCKQCVEEPGKRSRIWLAQDVCHVLTNNTGTEAVEGILLNMSEIIRKVNAGPTVFQKMYKLRFLKFHSNNVHGECKVYFPDGLHSLPDNLVYLHWDQYPLTSLPPNFIAENLVEINMRNSQVEKLWSDGVQHLGKLKKIDLSYSKYLTQIPDLSKASNLEYVYLDHCTSLYKIPASFQCLDKLDTLMLEGCSSLKMLPKLAPNIRCLVLNKTAIEEVPSSIGFVSKLEILCLRDCRRLVSLPNSICKLKSLKALCLSGCLELKTFPEIFKPMARLTILELDGTGITAFPFSVRNLIGIRPLNVNVLEEPKLIPCNMCKLEFSKCLSLRQLRPRLPCLDHPVYYLHQKHGETVIEIVSISRSSLIQGSKNLQLCGCQFLLYNCFKFGIEAHAFAIADNREDAKLFHKEIGGSKVKRGFSVDDFGIFCPGNDIPNWFCHQSEGSSIFFDPWEHSGWADLGFAICVIIGFRDNYPKSGEIKLLCRPSYKLSDGHKLSCDFHGHYSYEESNRILCNLGNTTWYFHANGGSVRSKIIGGFFEFFCVDENYELLEGCIVQRCGTQLLSSTYSSSSTLKYSMFHLLKNIFEKDKSEPCASGSEFDDSNCTEENEEDGPNGCIPLEVVSISSSTLKRHFETDNIYNQNFRFHNFLQVHKRACNNKNTNNPKVKVFDREISLSEFKRELVTGEDIGSCCLGNEMNPNWFSYQSKGRSLDVYLPPNWPDTNFLGFVVCAVINIKDFSLRDHQRHFKLLCRCHYICEFPYLISWDFQWDHGCIAYCEADDRSPNLDRKFHWNLDGKGKRKCGINRFAHNGNVAMASFNFWCVDKNNQPIYGCYIKQCGIQLLYAEQPDLINEQNFFKSKQEEEEEEEEEEEDISKFEPKGSGNRTVDSELKGKEDSKTSGCRPMEVVSVERPHQQFGNEFRHLRFQYFSFFELHEKLRNYKVARAQSKFECKVSSFKRVLIMQNQQIFAKKKVLEDFSYQSEGSSITVDIPTPYSPNTNLIGFLVSAIVEFKDCQSDCQCFKLLCRPHYMGKISHLLSWDFHGDNSCFAYYNISEYNEGTDFDGNFQKFWHRDSNDVVGKRKPLNEEEYNIDGVSFDFWCVDENYEPLENCLVRKCAVEPLTLEEEEEEAEIVVDGDIKDEQSGQLNGDGGEVDGDVGNKVSGQLRGSDYEEQKKESNINFGTSILGFETNKEDRQSDKPSGTLRSSSFMRMHRVFASNNSLGIISLQEVTAGGSSGTNIYLDAQEEKTCSVFVLFCCFWLLVSFFFFA